MNPWFWTEPQIELLRETANSWVGTPFRPHAREKGKGCSCQSLVGAIYIEVGFLPTNFKIPEGRVDWGRAQRVSIMEEHIDGKLDQYFGAVDKPRAGDLLGFRVSGCVHHLGICLGDGFVHCLNPQGVRLNNMRDATYLTRLARVWRPKQYEQEPKKLEDHLAGTGRDLYGARSGNHGVH